MFFIIFIIIIGILCINKIVYADGLELQDVSINVTAQYSYEYRNTGIYSVTVKSGEDEVAKVSKYIYDYSSKPIGEDDFYNELNTQLKEKFGYGLDEKAKEQGISGRTMRDVRSRMKNELEYQINEKQENSIRLKE